MNWWGKLIGTGVGMFGGPVGALVGAALGHAYDKKNPEVTDERKARGSAEQPLPGRSTPLDKVLFFI